MNACTRAHSQGRIHPKWMAYQWTQSIGDLQWRKCFMRNFFHRQVYFQFAWCFPTMPLDYLLVVAPVRCMLHPWHFISGNLQVVMASFPASAHLKCEAGGKKRNMDASTKACRFVCSVRTCQVPFSATLLQLQAWVATGTTCSTAANFKHLCNILECICRTGTMGNRE